jgi:hypothetical protein
LLAVLHAASLPGPVEAWAGPAPEDRDVREERLAGLGHAVGSPDVGEGARGSRAQRDSA